MQVIRHIGALITIGAAYSLQAADFGAIDTVRRYSAAMMANDCETVHAMTSSRLIVRDKRPNETHDILCQMVAMLHRDDVVETLDPPKASLSDGDRKVVFVPAHREFGWRERRRVTNFDYVIHSSDGGRTWQVLDLGCVNARWIREVYPSYTGEPPVKSVEMKYIEWWKHDR